MAVSGDVNSTTYPAMSRAVRQRASKKIAHMMEEKRGDKDWPRERVIAASIRMAREGKIGPEGGYRR